MTGLAPGLMIRPESLIMWNGNVRALPLAEQVAATAAAGFDQLSVTPLDWVQWVASGLGSDEMRAIAADHGVQLGHLDPLTRWTTPWEPTNLDAGKYPLPFFAFETDDFLRIAEAIGATSLSRVEPTPGSCSTCGTSCAAGRRSSSCAPSPAARSRRSSSPMPRPRSRQGETWPTTASCIVCPSARVSSRSARSSASWLTWALFGE